MELTLRDKVINIIFVSHCLFMSLQSETLREVTTSLDLSADYREVSLLRESPRGRLYSAVRAGRRIVLKAAASSGTRDLEMLKREYETSSGLSHPHIAGIFTYEPDSPVGPCIVMEYVEGVSLGGWLASKPSQAARRRVFAQLLDAVGYLHRKGVLHNDLSAENVLISVSDNDVKLIDFGFSDDDAHFLAKGRGGTRKYASPELLSGTPLDSRSDIYSLGVLMRELFGWRCASVTARATRRNPSGRYPNVGAMRKAWMRCRRLPAVAAALVLLGAASWMTADFLRVKAEYDAVVDKVNARETLLDEYKSRVDAWYSEDLPVWKDKIDAAVGYRAKVGAWTELTGVYNAFWTDLFEAVPEEIRSDMMSYIAFKYSSLFPALPQQ